MCGGGAACVTGLLGASTALAGLTTTGCLRKPVEHILPFAKRPEDMIPGQAIYYATAIQVGHNVLGLLVESQDGRPTKIEGNPKHPMTAGASTSFVQASLLDMYDRFHHKGWTVKLSRDVRNHLGPIMAKTV